MKLLSGYVDTLFPDLRTIRQVHHGPHRKKVYVGINLKMVNAIERGEAGDLNKKRSINLIILFSRRKQEMVKNATMKQILFQMETEQ